MSVMDIENIGFQKHIWIFEIRHLLESFFGQFVALSL